MFCFSASLLVRLIPNRGVKIIFILKDHCFWMRHVQSAGVCMWECVRPSCWISAVFHQRREFPPSSPSLSICVYPVNLIRRLENPWESLAHLGLCANCKHATAGNVLEEPVNQVQKTTLKVGATSQNCLTVCDILFWLPDAHTYSRRGKKKDLRAIGFA